MKKPVVDNWHVYGLYESIRGAKFPMAVDVSKLNSDLTPGIKALAQSAAGYHKRPGCVEAWMPLPEPPEEEI